MRRRSTASSPSRSPEDVPHLLHVRVDQAMRNIFAASQESGWEYRDGGSYRPPEPMGPPERYLLAVRFFARPTDEPGMDESLFLASLSQLELIERIVHQTDRLEAELAYLLRGYPLRARVQEGLHRSRVRAMHVHYLCACLALRAPRVPFNV